MSHLICVSSIISRARHVLVRYELLITLALAPMFLFPSPLRATAVLVFPAAWLANGGRRLGLPATPLTITLLGLAGLAVCSLGVSADPRYSLGKVTGTVYGVACFFAIVRWMGRGRRQLEWARAGFVGVAAAFAVFALLTTNWITKIRPLGIVTDRLPRLLPQLAGAEGGLQPNGIAGLLVLFVPALVVLAVDAWRQRPLVGRTQHAAWAQSAALALVAATLLLTQSRGAWVGCTVALAGLGLLFGQRLRIATMLALLLLMAVFAAVGPSRLAEVVVATAGPGVESNVIGRRELWVRALAVIHDFPLTGVGMNMFRRVVPVLYPTTLLVPGLQQDVVHAHNQWLQVAVELGLPGLVFYVALWLGLTQLLFAAYRAAIGADRRLVAGLAMGFVAHAVYGISDAIALGAKLGLLFWIVLAFAVGTCLRIHGATSAAGELCKFGACTRQSSGAGHSG